MRKKEAKSRFANYSYFLKKAENGKLCKHNQERGRSSHGRGSDFGCIFEHKLTIFTKAVDSHVRFTSL